MPDELVYLQRDEEGRPNGWALFPIEGMATEQMRKSEADQVIAESLGNTPDWDGLISSLRESDYWPAVMASPALYVVLYTVRDGLDLQTLAAGLPEMARQFVLQEAMKSNVI